MGGQREGVGEGGREERECGMGGVKEQPKGRVGERGLERGSET